MRLQIVVPDSTKASTKQLLEDLVRRLNADPELADTLWLDDLVSAEDDSEIQAKFTAEVIAALESDHREVRDGKFLTPNQVQESVNQTLQAWRATNQG